MPFFCACRICKINSKDGNGRVLSTKKTFKKHQKKEKASIEVIDKTEIESSNESISSCNVVEKRKFEGGSDGSDINSENNFSDNDTPFSIPLRDISKR